MSTELTRSRLSSILSYDKETGEFTWKQSLGSRTKVGAVAGTKTSQGHLAIRIEGRLYQAHHLVWLYEHGCFSSTPIRHKDGNRSNNKLSNLEQVSRSGIASHLVSEPITPENVSDIFSYSEGMIFWKSSLTGKNRVARKRAGGQNQDGYLVVEVSGKAYGVHRLVWLMHEGSWPLGEIDHINGIRSDNRIENLRDVVRQTNAENRRSAGARSATGILGVEYLPRIGKYRARIRVNGKLIRLGTFQTASEAEAAYVEAKRLHHIGCTI